MSESRTITTRLRCEGRPDEIVYVKSDDTLENTQEFLAGKAKVQATTASFKFYDFEMGRKIEFMPSHISLQRRNFMEVFIKGTPNEPPSPPQEPPKSFHEKAMDVINQVGTVLNFAVSAATIAWRVWQPPPVPRLTTSLDRLLMAIEAPLNSCPTPVGLTVAVDDILAHIQATIKERSSDSLRKEPYMVYRCSQGGKTTFLCELYGRLRADGINTMLVSFHRDKLEPPSAEELYCEITNQLAEGIKGKDPRHVDWAALDRHISEGGPFVLLIDEINVVGVEITGELGTILKRYFLNPANRQLVFSSRCPILGVGDAGDDPRERVNYACCARYRFVNVVSLPVSWSVDQLTAMAGCDEVTYSLTVYFGGVPSLIYVDQTQSGLDTPSVKLNEAFPTLADSNELGPMASLIMSGRTTVEMEKYLQYCTAALEDNLMRYRLPACYIAPMLERISGPRIAQRIAHALRELKTAAGVQGNGEAWKVVVRVAITLRLVLASLDGPWGHPPPCALCSVVGAVGADVDMFPLGTAARTVADCEAAIQEYARGVVVRTLVVFYRTEATEHQFDGFAALILPGGKLSSVAGYQCKSSIKGEIPTWISKGGFLFCEQAPQRSGPPPPARWTCYTRSQAADFLGFSLQVALAYPEGGV